MPYIDLTPALKEAAARGELVFFLDDGHWNARRNEIAAETIARYLNKNGWPENSGLFKLYEIKPHYVQIEHQDPD